MIKLRDYQENIVQQVRDNFEQGKKSLIVQAPTGAGKTVIFSYIAQQAASRKKKILIVTDRAELLIQTHGALSEFGLHAYKIQAGTRFISQKSDVFVGMTQTLRNRFKNPAWQEWLKNEIDLVIIDEAHIQISNHLFEKKLLQNKFVLGFTATPRRSGKMRQLGIDYEGLIIGPSVAELIERGFLVRDDYFGTKGASLDGLKYSAMKGDFAEKEMFQAFNKSKLYAGVVKNWLEVAKGTKTIVFCVNIEHVIHTVEEFQKNGIDARFVTSSMAQPRPLKLDASEGDKEVYNEKLRLYDLYVESFGYWSGERSRIIKGFKQGDFNVLVNAGIATTGFDVPNIKTVIVNRATLSTTLWLQMVGRGSRIYPGKESFNILDFGENAPRLGHYTAPQNWALWHEASKEGGGVPPMKDCGFDSKGRVIKSNKEGCGRMILAAYKVCPFCGFKYPKKKLQEVELNSILFDGHKSRPIKKITEMTNDELEEYRRVKGHKQAWLWNQLHFRGGEELLQEYARRHHWKPGTIRAALQYVRKFAVPKKFN